MQKIEFSPDTPEIRKRYNDLARLQTITRLEADILADMEICDIEGWDKTEYIRLLQDKLDSLLPR